MIAVRVHVPGAGIGRNCRYSVDRETPSAWATSTIGVPSVIILVACLRSTGLSTVGHDYVRPLDPGTPPTTRRGQIPERASSQGQAIHESHTTQQT